MLNSTQPQRYILTFDVNIELSVDLLRVLGLCRTVNCAPGHRLQLMHLFDSQSQNTKNNEMLTTHNVMYVFYITSLLLYSVTRHRTRVDDLWVVNV